ncbi:carbohydrate porin [Vibrio sp. CAU 1672]|uniref:carbohydrate porin n=1 Tax=Vibrio sp. CAU 1672 TaxID=3032594 RepID=UPI0023DCBFDD|nr:carbohydrate porin [Vibrio sp. CAU 1672]MDF2154603.1 carbohydrate porin [Vibrio sp. CAU 1672]
MNHSSKALVLTTVPAGHSMVALATTEFDNHLIQDWGGTRTQLDNAGVSIEAEYTNVFQAPLSDTPKDKDNFSHRFDLLTSFDFEALGLWKGGKLNTQVVSRGGSANDFGLVHISSPNSSFFADDESLFISAFNYSHKFSDDTSVIVGKIDAFELLRNAPFYGGATRHGFMNLAFSAPPSGVVPPAFFGAVANHRLNDTLLTAMFFDPRSRYTKNLSTSGLFDDGVSFSLGVTHKTSLFDRQSLISAACAYSTEEGADFSSLTPDLNFDSTAKYKYNARMQFSHNLVEKEGDASESWGLHLRGSIADGNPNMFRMTFAGGLGGKALFFNRPMDNWGLGYYYNLSNDLQNSVNNLDAPFEIQNEQGFEAYYAYQVTPWLTFTTDVQYITPALSTQDDAWLFGLRTNIRF